MHREVCVLAGGRTRTNTLLLGADFESAASAISPHRRSLAQTLPHLLLVR